MKHSAVYFGIVGTAGTVTLNQVNSVLAFIAGVLTVGVMLLRFRREWKRRNLSDKDET